MNLTSVWSWKFSDMDNQLNTFFFFLDACYGTVTVQGAVGEQ